MCVAICRSACRAISSCEQDDYILHSPQLCESSLNTYSIYIGVKCGRLTCIYNIHVHVCTYTKCGSCALAVVT